MCNIDFWGPYEHRKSAPLPSFRFHANHAHAPRNVKWPPSIQYAQHGTWAQMQLFEFNKQADASVEKSREDSKVR